MARPKHIEGEPTAYDRIAEAYWAELAEKEYSKITITSLARRAGVNHNLLYYYFQNIDEMAIRFFEDNTTGQFSARFFINALLQGKDVSPAIDGSTLKKLQRVKLYARGDSAYLTGIFQKALINTWLDGSDQTWDMLSPEDRFDLLFVIGGLTTILGNAELSDTPDKMLDFSRREIGVSTRDTLNRIRGERTIITAALPYKQT